MIELPVLSTIGLICNSPLKNNQAELVWLSG